MMYVIMVSIIIILLCENKKLSDENKLFRLKMNRHNTNIPNNSYTISNTENVSVNQPNTSYVNNTLLSNQHPKKVINEKELKNNVILITGSVLIVVSSIIFLLSSWYSISNIIKMLVILFMLIIFLLSSHIADKYLNLKQTSKAFYYISLAYVPLALLSISIFELFGNYLSFYGAGKYIYLALSSLLVSLIYYLCNKSKKSYLLASVNHAFHILTIIFTCLIVTNEFKIIFIFVLLYNIIYGLLYIKNQYFINEKYHLNSSNVLSIIAIISSFNCINDYFTNNIMFSNVIISTLILINLFISLVKINKKHEIYNWIYPLLSIQIAFNISLINNFPIIFEQLLIIAAIAIIFIIDIFNTKKINWSTFLETLGCLILLCFKSDYTNQMKLNIETILLISSIFALINYYLDDKHKKISAHILCGVINSFLLFVTLTNVPNILAFYIVLVLIIISKLWDKMESNLSKAINNIGNIFICLLILFVETNVFYLLFILIYTILNFFIGTNENKVNYRILSYIFLNLMLFKSFTFFNLSYKDLIFPFTTTIIFISEMFNKCEKSRFFKVYLFGQFIASFISLYLVYELYAFIILIPLIAMYLKYINFYHLNTKLSYIGYCAFIPYVYDSSVFIIKNFDYMYLISFILLIGYLFLFNHRKNIGLIITYFVYTYLHIVCFDSNVYLNYIIILAGVIISILNKSGITKEIFKGILYSVLLSLYYTIIKDFNLNEISLFSIGILFIYLLLITRTILKKYMSEYKTFEYIFGVVINLLALMWYRNETDGLIFVFGLVLLLIISYINKFGPLFAISLIFILINILILTRTFWLSIPWWLYILLIGTILIVFAIRNEMKEKQNNEIKNKLEDIKKNLDM